MISISFFGAAGTVTGSKYLVQVNNRRVMIDCGMFQGRRELRQLNWQPPAFDPTAIDAVIVTHAHIDHLGYLPKLVAMGFAGPVFATEPTTDIASVLLFDSAHLMKEDADYRNRKGLTRHKKALPLFTADDVQVTLNRIEPVYFDKWTRLNDEIKFRHRCVGHILGAGSVELQLDDGNKKLTVLFSGDIGRYGSPMMPDPDEPPAVDYLVCESTYGGRLHPAEDPYFTMANLINDVVRRKSVLLIPAFAIGRTQQIIYIIRDLVAHRRIPLIPIHIDSPMAVSATNIYCRYPGYHRVEVNRFGGPDCVLHGKNVKLHRKRKSSKLLNKLKGPAIIVSASGMMSGGRIMHHLINRLPDESTTLLLVGFSAEGTLGRRVANGDKMVYIHKQPVEVNARVVSLHGLSAHADYHEILHWLEPVPKRPQKVFVTHGEASQSAAMAEHFRTERQWDCHIPSLDETVTL